MSFAPLVGRRLAALVAGFAVLATTSSHAVAQDPRQVLVTPAWLKQHLQDKNLVLLQIGERATYDTAHIAGAQFVELSNISTGAGRDPTVLSLEMLPEDTLRARLQGYGISNDSRIVVYFSDEWGSPSSRVLFTMTYAGLGSNVSLLDGGLVAWRAAGLPATAVVPKVVAGHLTTHVNPGIIVDHAYVQAHLNAPHIRIVDARAPVFYVGQTSNSRSDSTQRGHIPSAGNFPFDAIHDSLGRVLPNDSLVKLFRAAGVQKGDTVVAYCHVGQQATNIMLAARILGYPYRLYDGSMQDWAMRKLPLEMPKP